MNSTTKIEFSTIKDALMPLYLLFGELSVILIGSVYYRILVLSPLSINWDLLRNFTTGDRIVGTLIITGVLISIPIFLLISIKSLLTDEFYEYNPETKEVILNNIRWNNEAIKIEEIKEIFITKGEGTYPGGYEEPEEPWFLYLEFINNERIVVHSSPLKENVIKRENALSQLIEMGGENDKNSNSH